MKTFESARIAAAQMLNDEIIADVYKVDLDLLNSHQAYYVSEFFDTLSPHVSTFV